MKTERPLITTLWANIDALWTLLACFLICTLVLITQINANKSQEATSNEQPAGQVSVYCFWGDNLDIDVDTHLAAPGDDPVFFAHLAGRIWNLLRDDLGQPGDPTPRNFENAYARGLEPGEYGVNVHVYRANPNHLPVQVDCEIRIASDPTRLSSDLVYRQSVTLEHVKDEKTVIRFTIGQNGRVVPGSVNRNYKKLVRQK